MALTPAEYQEPISTTAITFTPDTTKISLAGTGFTSKKQGDVATITLVFKVTSSVGTSGVKVGSLVGTSAFYAYGVVVTSNGANAGTYSIGGSDIYITLTSPVTTNVYILTTCTIV